MKKLSVVAVAVSLFVGSAFASWDYFPPKEAGKGQARLNFNYVIPAEKWSEMDLAIKGRYTIIDGLEAAVSLPIPLSLSYDGNSMDDYAGLSQPEIGVRYWLPMGLGFFADFVLPVDTRDAFEPPFGLAAGVQFSTKFTEELALGTELKLNVPFEDKGKFKEGMSLNIGAEVDYSIGGITPFLGVEAALGLTKPQWDGNDAGDADPFGLDLWIGAAYSINDMFSVDLSATFGLGEGKGGEDNTPIKISFDFDFHF